jgi:hypothetical protein
MIPGRLMQVDVSPAEVVWGVNSAHFIYLRVGSQGNWKHIRGLLKHVSVGEAGVWGVNKYDEIWYREGVSSSNVAGTRWQKLGGEDILYLQHAVCCYVSLKCRIPITHFSCI